MNWDMNLEHGILNFEIWKIKFGFCKEHMNSTKHEFILRELKETQIWLDFDIPFVFNITNWLKHGKNKQNFKFSIQKCWEEK